MIGNWNYGTGRRKSSVARVFMKKGDGQILVTDDLLGLFDWTPKFVRRYANLKAEIDKAAASYAADVKTRRFPAAAETYALGGGKARSPRVAGGDKRG